MYNGYVVYGQQLIVTTNENGEVTSLSGDHANIGVLFNPSVNITATEAAALITEYGEFDAESAELVVYTLDGYNEMAYVLENDAYSVVISAADGTVITDATKVLTALPSEPGTIFTETGSDNTGNTFNTMY
jgi:Zn-dependent metalloprotease